MKEYKSVIEVFIDVVLERFYEDFQELIDPVDLLDIILPEATSDHRL